MSLLEVIAVIVSALGVWLTVRRTMLCWPVGIVSVLLYAWIFFQAKLYSDLLLQIIFAVLQVYGWWRWLQGRAADEVVTIERPSSAALIYGVLAGAVGSVLLGFLMARYTDAAVPWVDASLTSFSLVAQFWMARKYVMCWLLWIAVDVIYVGVYAYKVLYLTAGLYAAFVVLAAMGWHSWRAALARQ